MYEANELTIKENEVEKYLSSGLQTNISPEIQKIASEIKGAVLEKVQKILEFGPTLVEVREYDKNIFRKRTGEEIIRERYITGCTDAVLAFIVISRASGIPTKYVETIDVGWLKSGGDTIDGHVYAQVYDYLQDEWVWVDPMFGEIGKSPTEKQRVVFAEGLDSWDLGIKDENSLRSKFEEFRNQFNLQL